MPTIPKVVMIADADPRARELVSRFLTESGYTITIETDGYEALDHARASPPTALLADLLLPRLDGLALCRLIKSDSATEHSVTVIVFSVLSAEGRALKAGADAFIQKPLEKNRLLAVLKEAIIKRHQTA